MHDCPLPSSWHVELWRRVMMNKAKWWWYTSIFHYHTTTQDHIFESTSSPYFEGHDGTQSLFFGFKSPCTWLWWTKYPHLTFHLFGPEHSVIFLHVQSWPRVNQALVKHEIQYCESKRMFHSIGRMCLILCIWVYRPTYNIVQILLQSQNHVSNLTSSCYVSHYNTRKWHMVCTLWPGLDGIEFVSSTSCQPLTFVWNCEKKQIKKNSLLGSFVILEFYRCKLISYCLWYINIFNGLCCIILTHYVPR